MASARREIDFVPSIGQPGANQVAWRSVIRLTRYRSPNLPQDDGFYQPVPLIPVQVSHTRRTCRLCVWYWWRILSQHRWMLWVSASEPNPTHSLQLLLCECLHLEPTRMKKINPEPTQEKITFSEASVTHMDPTRLKQSNIYLLLKALENRTF